MTPKMIQRPPHRKRAPNRMGPLPSAALRHECDHAKASEREGRCCSACNESPLKPTQLRLASRAPCGDLESPRQPNSQHNGLETPAPHQAPRPQGQRSLRCFTSVTLSLRSFSRSPKDAASLSPRRCAPTPGSDRLSGPDRPEQHVLALHTTRERSELVVQTRWEETCPRAP